jgi:hypothetical protein
VLQGLHSHWDAAATTAPATTATATATATTATSGEGDDALDGGYFVVGMKSTKNKLGLLSTRAAAATHHIYTCSSVQDLKADVERLSVSERASLTLTNAECMLRLLPNGFGVWQGSEPAVRSLQHMALTGLRAQPADTKIEDAAHYMFVLPVELLKRLAAGGRDGGWEELDAAALKADRRILEELLAKGDVSLPPQSTATTATTATTAALSGTGTGVDPSSFVTLASRPKLHFHIVAALALMQRQQRKATRAGAGAGAGTGDFWLVTASLGGLTTGTGLEGAVWNLDLPGGKQDPWESHTMQGLTRETREEAGLVLDWGTSTHFRNCQVRPDPGESGEDSGIIPQTWRVSHTARSDSHSHRSDGINMFVCFAPLPVSATALEGEQEEERDISTLLESLAV